MGWFIVEVKSILAILWLVRVKHVRNAFTHKVHKATEAWVKPPAWLEVMEFSMLSHGWLPYLASVYVKDGA